MEYLLIGGIALVVFIIFFIIITVKQIRDRANALFLQAEKYVTEDKLLYVSENLYEYLPTVAKIFLKPEGFDRTVQKLYDKTRRLAKDLLDDGKLNKSIKEE